MGRKFDFYDIRRTIKSYPDAKYYMIYGERSNGKTYSALDYALERFAKAGEQFAYVRRWGEDIRPKNLGTLFDGHVRDGRISYWTGGALDSVNYSRSRFFLYKSNDDGSRDEMEEPAGFAFDLNSMEHYKSTSFPKVRTIIFDEFMSRNGYLPNEWILFTNTLSTIIRLRNDVKIFMLGNTVNKYCPYFSEMGINHIKDQKPGTIDIYHYGQTDLEVVCEYTESSSKRGGKPSDIYFAFDNPELRMITDGSWEISIYPHLEKKPRPADHVTDFFVEFENELLHGEIIAADSGPYIFLHAKTTPIKDPENDIVYTTKPNIRWNYRMALTKHSDKLSLFIQQCLRENRIFYSTNEIGEVFRNYVMWSDTYSIKN